MKVARGTRQRNNGPEHTTSLARNERWRETYHAT
jgi:hypothetical protein